MFTIFLFWNKREEMTLNKGRITKVWIWWNLSRQIVVRQVQDSEQAQFPNTGWNAPRKMVSGKIKKIQRVQVTNVLRNRTCQIVSRKFNPTKLTSSVISDGILPAKLLFERSINVTSLRPSRYLTSCPFHIRYAPSEKQFSTVKALSVLGWSNLLGEMRSMCFWKFDTI